MAQASTETEIKLAADGPEALAGLRGVLTELCTDVRPSAQRHVRDIYVDTEDWRLYQAGVALRLRQSPESTLLTLKALGSVQEGLAERLEVEEVLPTVPEPVTGELPGDEIARLLRPVVAGSVLVTKLVIEKSGEVFHAVARKGLGLKVTSEVVSIEGAPGGTFAEAELELVAGRPKDLRRLGEDLRRRLHVRPSPRSKFDHAVQVLGLRPPQFVEGEDLRIRKKDRFVDAAYRVLRRHHARMTWHELGTRLGLDPEHVHDMRVATRRMRAALRVFRHGLPNRRVASMERDLTWLASALGGVRDLDVHLKRFDEEVQTFPESAREALQAYRLHLREERDKRRDGLLRALDSRRYGAFLDRTRRFLRAGPPKRPSASAARGPVRAEALRPFEKRLMKVLHEGREIRPDSPDTALHALRIRCKKLRYVCEFFADLYDPEAGRLSCRVTELQDALGEHQDACVAQTMLEGFALGMPVRRAADRRLGLALGHLLAHHAQHAHEARQAFVDLWSRLDQKKVFAPLKKRMNKLARKG